MKAAIRFSFSLGMIGLGLGQGWAVAQSFAVAPSSSPYQQLLRTKECNGCNLSNLNLKGLDLSGANLENANLSNTDLSDANLSNAKLTGANLYLANLEQVNLSNADLTRANLGSAKASGASFRQANFTQTKGQYADFSDANFSSAEIKDSSFSDANLDGATFSNASIDNTKFDYTTLDKTNNSVGGTQPHTQEASPQESSLKSSTSPVISRSDSQNESFRVSQSISPYQQLINTKECSGCNLSNLDLRGLDLSGANLESANLSNADLSNSILRQANLTDANLYLANLSQTDLSQANLIRTNLSSVKAAGTSLSQAKIAEVDGSYADLSNTNFEEALISDSNFSDANLTGAVFTSASIENTKFNYANLDQVEFSSASVNSSSFTSASTEGTTLPEQSSNPTLISDSSSQSSDNTDAENSSLEDRPASPLLKNAFPQPTGNHLNRGDLIVGFTNRQFFESATNDDGSTSANPGVHLEWGVTDSTQLGLSFQAVDTGLPTEQGAFRIRRTDNLDGTLSLKQNLWKNESGNTKISAVASVAVGDRNAEFTQGGVVQTFSNNDVIPTLQVPLTGSFSSDRLNLTLSPTVAFFPNDHALFFRRPPTANPGSFGTTFGLAGAISYEVSPRLALWGDAFVPFTGNNSINTNTGLPAKAVAFNSGFRFLVNPRIGLDLFASNSLGQRAPLGLTAIRDNVSVGVGITVLPELFASNRKYGDSYRSSDDGTDSPLTVDGIGYTDGGTVPKNRLALQVQGGQQGVLTAIRYGVARDFEVFGYLDYVLGNDDESEQGAGLKLRLLDQHAGDPVTVSATGSVGLTNEVFTNFINNDPNAFRNSGADKEVPLLFQSDSPGGRRFLISASLPIHYKVNDKFNTWLTPTVGYVQRLGVELAGFNFGASHELARDISLLAEVGANFIGRGNSFNNAGLVDRIPWTAALRWNPSSALGRNPESLIQPHIEVYVTNRVGSSTWNQLRVREGGDPAVGVGVQIPF